MRKCLTPLSLSFIGWFISLFLIGLLFGNMVFIFMGFIPLFLLLFGLLMDQPREVEIEPEDLKKWVWTDDELDINIRVRIRKGVGIVMLVDELPPTFKLVEGNNFRVLWKGLGEKELMFSYKVKCVKRGSYKLANIKWESRNVLGLKKEISGTGGTAVELTVKPRTMELRNIRGKKDLASSLFPRADMSKIGVCTTDFKEIRDYQYGDLSTKINWKATAKRMGGSSLAMPLVNEYEREGKKAVWIFLDASSSLEIGTSIDNTFEYALKSADAVLRYFTEREYRVGMYLYNDGEKLFYPDSGKKQYFKLSKELVKLKSYHRNEGLDNAVRKCREYILRYNPLSIVITEIRSESSKSLIEGIKKLSLMSGGRRRKRVPLMVVNVLSYYLNPTPPSEYREYAIMLQRIKHSPIASKLRRVGATVVEWNPQKDRFTTVLLGQGKGR